MTKIPWTEKTWNPVVGCSKVSPGCLNCYAERMALRQAHMELARYEEHANDEYPPQFMGGKYFDVVDLCKRKWNGKIFCDEKALEIPLHWKKPRMIFVCSMGDLFHPSVPFEFIEKAMAVIEECQQHTFQLLTKRPHVMLEYFSGIGQLYKLSCCSNLWFGVTAENQEWWDKRKEALFGIPATVHFVSNEPLLSRIVYTDDDLKRLDWVIIGCESGPNRRPCKLEWVWSLIQQCRAAGVAPFVKQLSIKGKVSKDMSEWPPEFRIREYPKGRR